MDINSLVKPGTALARIEIDVRLVLMYEVRALISGTVRPSATVKVEFLGVILWIECE